METVVGMIRSCLGSTTRGRTYWSRRRDPMLMVLAHNRTVLVWRKLFQQIRVFC